MTTPRKDLSENIGLRMIDILRPNGGYVMALEAYFDESGTHEGAEIMCVVAYLFQTENAKALSHEWQAVLDSYAGRLTHFHMVDCAHGVEDFASLSKPERIECASRMIQIIRRYMTHGFAVSVNRSAYAKLMPYHPQIGDDYHFCIWNIIVHIEDWRKVSGDNSEIAYFFEAGHESEKWLDANLNGLFNKGSGEPASSQWPGYAAHAFIKKRNSVLIQAADLLAWQHAKYAKCSLEGRSVRRDLRALIDGHEHKYRIIHYNSPRILKAVGDILAQNAWGDLQATSELHSS